MGLVFGLLFFLIPLVFYPKSSEVFEFNKIILLYSGTIGITSIWAIKMIVQKKIIFRRTILDIPLVIFLMSQAISTLVSIDPHTSIFGYYSRFNGGLLSTAAYCLLYWAFVSNISLREARKVICLALFSGLIVSIYGILEHTGRSPSCLLINRQFNTWSHSRHWPGRKHSRPSAGFFTPLPFSSSPLFFLLNPVRDCWALSPQILSFGH